MIVYRDDEGEAADPGPLLDACGTRARAMAADGAAHDAAAELLIDLGVIEAAVVDALCPEVDAMPPLAAALRRASLAAGRLFRGSWRGEPGGSLRAAAGAVAAALDVVPGPLPRPVRLRVPEGYAFYALYPETYLEAAEQFAASAGPRRVVVVGLRSIGTSLSAAAAAGLEARGWTVESVTLRPRGHPFARRPSLEPGLARALGERRDDWFLVVDEGPGLSGSSFAGTAELLADLGVPDGRVVLLPSHLPDSGALNSAAARERWPRHAKAHAAFEEVWLPRAPFPPGSRDVAGGAWREALGLAECRWPAVEPRHERRKYLAEAEGGGRVLHKFVGLGRHGREAHARAVALEEAGFGPPALGLAEGFLAQGFVPGSPVGTGEAEPMFLETAARYLGHLARAFARAEPARPEALLPMLRVNVAEALGEPGLAGLAGLERHLRGFGNVPAVALDARVLPHEWVRSTAGGFLKMDATDHHRDHFFPGYADIAWDVAGFGVEFGLGEAELSAFAAEVARHAGGDPGLAGRLPFYGAAYAAFRLGYAAHAARTLGRSSDAGRMARLAVRHRARLGRAVRRLAAALPEGSEGATNVVAR